MARTSNVKLLPLSRAERHPLLHTLPRCKAKYNTLLMTCLLSLQLSSNLLGRGSSQDRLQERTLLG